MEDIYLVISDCVCNLSKLFTFHPLLELSLIHKLHAQFIYELTIHDHDKQPIYHTSVDQIKRFHNIDTLTIPRYYDFYFDNVSKLTHIYNIRFYKTSLVSIVTNLTHLTSYRCFGSEYFHTNLKRLLYIQDNGGYKMENNEFKDINHLRLHGLDDVEQLLLFTNLKSLHVEFLQDISKLSQLKSLHALQIDIFRSDVVIHHPTLTRIEIWNSKHCTFQNCFNLKFIELIEYKSCSLDTYSMLQTIILISYQRKIDIQFDINKCIDLKYLKFDGNQIKINNITSSLIKLNQLDITLGANINIDNIIANNLTFLMLNNYLDTFDFGNYINLKKLMLYDVKYINIDNIQGLEYLTIRNKFENYGNVINCDNHRYLTFLNLMNCSFSNLFQLTKLHDFTFSRFDYFELRNIWNDMLYLSKLTSLTLFSKNSYGYDHSCETFDGKYLSNCVNLKLLACNLSIGHLNMLTKIIDLSVLKIEIYGDIITQLTKLTRVEFLNEHDTELIFDLTNLNRLVIISGSIKNIIFPETKMLK